MVSSMFLLFYLKYLIILLGYKHELRKIVVLLFSRYAFPIIEGDPPPLRAPWSAVPCCKQIIKLQPRSILLLYMLNHSNHSNHSQNINSNDIDFGVCIQ